MSNVILLAFCLVLTTPINAQGPEIEVWAAPTHVKAAQIFTVHIKARSASPFSVDARIHLPPRCYAVQGLRGDSLSIHEENLRADKPHEWAAVINSETTDPGGLKTVAVDVNGQTYHVTVYVEAILQTRIQSQTPSPTNTHTSIPTYTITPTGTPQTTETASPVTYTPTRAAIPTETPSLVKTVYPATSTPARQPFQTNTPAALVTVAWIESRPTSIMIATLVVSMKTPTPLPVRREIPLPSATAFVGKPNSLGIGYWVVSARPITVTQGGTVWVRVELGIGEGPAVIPDPPWDFVKQEAIEVYETMGVQLLWAPEVFTITQYGAAEQPIVPGVPTIWEWMITPRVPGAHELIVRRYVSYTIVRGERQQPYQESFPDTPLDIQVLYQEPSRYDIRQHLGVPVLGYLVTFLVGIIAALTPVLVAKIQQKRANATKRRQKSPGRSNRDHRKQVSNEKQGSSHTLQDDAPKSMT